MLATTPTTKRRWSKAERDRRPGERAAQAEAGAAPRRPAPTRPGGRPCSSARTSARSRRSRWHGRDGVIDCSVERPAATQLGNKGGGGFRRLAGQHRQLVTRSGRWRNLQRRQQAQSALGRAQCAPARLQRTAADLEAPAGDAPASPGWPGSRAAMPRRARALRNEWLTPTSAATATYVAGLASRDTTSIPVASRVRLLAARRQFPPGVDRRGTGCCCSRRCDCAGGGRGIVALEAEPCLLHLRQCARLAQALASRNAGVGGRCLLDQRGERCIAEALPPAAAVASLRRGRRVPCRRFTPADGIRSPQAPGAAAWGARGGRRLLRSANTPSSRRQAISQNPSVRYSLHSVDCAQRFVPGKMLGSTDAMGLQPVGRGGADRLRRRGELRFAAATPPAGGVSGLLPPKRCRAAASLLNDASLLRPLRPGATWTLSRALPELHQLPSPAPANVVTHADAGTGARWWSRRQCIQRRCRLAAVATGLGRIESRPQSISRRPLTSFVLAELQSPLCASMAQQTFVDRHFEDGGVVSATDADALDVALFQHVVGPETGSAATCPRWRRCGSIR